MKKIQWFEWEYLRNWQTTLIRYEIIIESHRKKNDRHKWKSNQ